MNFSACPICHSEKVLEDFHVQHIPATFDVAEQEMHISHCESCGFLFQNPLLEQASSSEHYVENSNYTLEPSEGYWKAKENQLKWIEEGTAAIGFLDYLESKKRSKSILEIGCAVGAILKLSQQKGWVSEGLEPSPVACRYAREQYKLDVREGTIENLKQLDASVVLLSHVLEHIPNPTLALRAIANSATLATVLAVEVPDISRPKIRGGTTFWLCEHVNYFSPETLTHCALDAGWQLQTLVIHDYSRDEQEMCTYPVIRALFIKRTPAERTEARYLAKAQIEGAQDGQAQIFARKISDFLRKNVGDVIVFGAGWHTQMLFDIMTEEQLKRVKVILDSNPHRSGKFLRDKVIRHASSISDYSDLPIIVSSQGYQDQIVQQIHSAIGDRGRLLTFY
jgi:SAM-dependent methyltransferase